MSVLADVVAGGPLREAVLHAQRRAMAAIRATEFGALLRDRLRPVLQA